MLTGDRDVAMLGQREDQMIDQVGMYDRHVRKSVNLPVVKTDDDFIYCQRLVNEALLELDHNGQTGPVHINVPMSGTARRSLCRNFLKLLALNVLAMRLQLQNGKKRFTSCSRQSAFSWFVDSRAIFPMNSRIR